MTGFFEPINASATHIYHSALELCPVQSAVRKLYYDRYARIHHLPRVVVGTPDSWDPTISVSGKDHDYKFCAWSPCGRFVAAQTEKGVEIRAHLTFELVTILDLTETTLRLTGPLAYSPDGRSLACVSDAAILIWDIQTGGIAQEIECHTERISMAWSLDGKEIATIGSSEPPSVDTYGVFSGASLSVGKFHPGDNLHLWTYGDSFRVTAVRSGFGTASIEIFEVGDPPIKVHSFSTPFHDSPSTINTSFCPATYRISIEAGGVLRIFEGWNSSCLLKETGNFLSHCFSSDGSLFISSEEDGVRIWKYGSGHYSSWKKFRPRDWTNSSFRISPTPSSILVHSRSILQLWRIQDLPTAPHTGSRRQHAALRRSGNRIVIADISERIISIIDPHSPLRHHVIEPGFPIDGLVVVDNVLLAVYCEEAVAWLLPKEEEWTSSKRVSREGNIWAMRLPRAPFNLTCKVEGQVGVVESDEDSRIVFHTGTGEILGPIQAPPFYSDPPNLLGRTLCGRDYSNLYNVSQGNILPECAWRASETTLQEGWVRDPEGRHRLWVPVEWREIWDPVDWCHDIKIQFSILQGEPIVVKF